MSILYNFSQFVNQIINLSNRDNPFTYHLVIYYDKNIIKNRNTIYFITNQQTKGITEYFLMNKNKKIAKIKFDNENQTVTDIMKLYTIEYAPLECFHKGTITSIAITEWFRGRGIPSWRDGLDVFLDNIGIKNKDLLLNKAFGLSLSDQYWMNPVDRMMEWKDINFFIHNFDSDDYQKAMFDSVILDEKQINLYSPNNTSDGMLKKTWIVGSDNKRYLLKSSYKGKGMEPFNEILASKISEVLNLDHVTYSIEVIGRNILSKCECFVNENTELLSAYSILHYYEVKTSNDSKDVYETYIDILKSHGIENVETSLAKMFILDYIIANTDRHLGNFGIIRNIETLKWEKIAPNFDSGQALFSQKKVYEMNFNYIYGSFFNDKNMNFETILDIIKENINFKIDFHKLFKVADQWNELLYSYQSISKISSERIDTTVEGLKQRLTQLQQRLQ